MGLFSRNEPSGGSGRRSAARTSSEAQAAELRVRARRRLIGALVLVLTAVIFVPMLFDSPPEEELASPIVLPEQIPQIPAEPQVALAPESATAGNVAGVSPADATGVQTPQAPQMPAEGTVSADTAVSAEASPAAETEPAEPEPEPERAGPSPPPSQSAPAPEPPKPTPPKPAQREPDGRTDDGSVALALLEGRQPVSPPAAQSRPSSGSFILQVAAYTTDKDAQSRREKLVAAGVTNAYVEQAVANGKTAHRLRVGPFPTREAAEAAQARLRQLGYNNGLIFNK